MTVLILQWGKDLEPYEAHCKPCHDDTSNAIPNGTGTEPVGNTDLLLHISVKSASHALPPWEPELIYVLPMTKLAEGLTNHYTGRHSKYPLLSGFLEEGNRKLEGLAVLCLSSPEAPPLPSVLSS